MNTFRISSPTRRIAVLATAAAATSAVLAVVAPAAFAAQPTTTLRPAQDQLYSTAFWGETSFCARNDSRLPGQMYVASWGGAGGGPVVDVPALGTRCHSGWYFAVPARVKNTGTTPLTVTVTP
jgi:hypothetical protein